MRETLFESSNEVNAELKVNDTFKAITNHKAVIEFYDQFNATFKDFCSYLKAELLTDCQSVKINREKTVLSDAVFQRLKKIPLIDKYEAYQLLSDKWDRIRVDLEIIQAEGFEATRIVEPNMVTKKKNGKDVKNRKAGKEE